MMLSYFVCLINEGGKKTFFLGYLAVVQAQKASSLNFPVAAHAQTFSWP